MQITAPYGYDEIVPLQKTDRVLLPAGTTPAFCRKLNALAVSVAEFVIAGRDYPLVFASTDEGKTFAPVIVVGVQDSVNLFLDVSGEWDRRCYFPAFVRRFPFCISKVYTDGEAKGERIVCVAKAYVDAGGVMLFDEKGQPTAQWHAVERLLSEFEADLDRTAQLSAAMARLELLEPFIMQANDPPDIRLAGMYRVAETKLKALKPANLKALAEKGFLGLIYAHLHSLENFSRLVLRQRQRAAGKS
jgi:hypothetical protein